MAFQTVFYLKATGEIINVVPNKYIRSKAERGRFCPGHAPNDVSFLYFASLDTVGASTHKVQTAGPFHPPYVVDASGTPLVFMDKRRAFSAMLERFPTIIVEMYLSMGDNLLRAAAVAEASRFYPDTQFLCDVLPEYRDVMAMCPEITLFKGCAAHGLDPAKCGKILLAEGPLWDPRGPEFGKASLYGLYLNLPKVPYLTTLKLPPDFGPQFEDFCAAIGLRLDGHNVIFHLRSKDWSDKCWQPERIADLARMIHSVYDCKIFYLGSSNDLSGEIPGAVNLCGKTSWLQTVFLLTQASHVFCVDSAVMHLCRALGISYFCLWGHTTPDLILSRPPGPNDIMAPPKKGRIEMQEITPRQVFDRAFPRSPVEGELVFDPRDDVSDFGAQEIIFRFFNEHPPANKRLVDIGAHGKNSSNSYGLLAHGWTGLMIEANPERARICKRDFAGLAATVLNIGVSDEAGRLPLYMHKVVGSSSLLADWDPHEHTGKKILVNVEPVDKVLREHRIPDDLDFLSVDVEGLDYRVMKCIFEKTSVRPRLIITEAASYDDPAGFFNQHGYDFMIKLKQDRYGNLLFRRRA
jgi:FkbM family methyltransferase